MLSRIRSDQERARSTRVRGVSTLDMRQIYRPGVVGIALVDERRRCSKWRGILGTSFEG